MINKTQPDTQQTILNEYEKENISRWWKKPHLHNAAFKKLLSSKGKKIQIIQSGKDISLKERIKGANCELKKKIKKSFEGIFARSKKENTIKQAKTLKNYSFKKQVPLTQHKNVFYNMGRALYTKIPGAIKKK